MQTAQLLRFGRPLVCSSSRGRAAQDLARVGLFVKGSIIGVAALVQLTHGRVGLLFDQTLEVDLDELLAIGVQLSVQEAFIGDFIEGALGLKACLHRQMQLSQSQNDLLAHNRRGIIEVWQQEVVNEERYKAFVEGRH